MKRIRVSAAVIHSGNKILAAQRGYGPYKGGWEFPGGKQEKGETGEEAIIREIKEELELDIKVEKYLLTVEYDYPEFHLTMDSYIATPVSEHINPLEHSALRWVSIDMLDSINWLPADIEIKEKVKEYFKQGD